MKNLFFATALMSSLMLTACFEKKEAAAPTEPTQTEMAAPADEAATMEGAPAEGAPAETPTEESAE